MGAWWSKILCLALVCLGGHAWANSTAVPGQYFDPGRNGHGIDLQRVADVWILILYTYEDNGDPTWYLATATANDEGIIEGDFLQFSYDAGRFPPQQVDATVGQFSLDFSVDCNEGASALSASFAWLINGESAEWCMQPLLDESHEFQPDLTGTWYAGEDDPGWGLSLDLAGDGEPTAEFGVLFYYDSNGFPRWAAGVADEPGLESTLTMLTFRGYCRLCERLGFETEVAGSISYRVEIVKGVAEGHIDIDVDYAPDPGGGWHRANSPFRPLSDLPAGLLPLPEFVDADTPLAIKNVSVLPLTEGFPVVAGQTLLVEEGVISAIGDFGTVPIPEDAWHIDGRGLFLAPGLADMHTHLTASGQPAMNESGLLFIANGVTTVLNMGDGGTLDLPGIDDRFASGLLIGPTVYAGKDAYGTSDGRGPTQTVTNRTAATSFANLALSEGYDYLKLYNGLQPDVVDQFRIESERLGLPLIGHIPKSMSMQAALNAGMDMIAHTAEVYFTFFGNSQNQNLLQPAADLMISRGVYLTDTLTASESFADMYGGNTANYNAYLQRDGVQYIPQTMINGWTNFFNSSALQPPGSQPGQLDSRLAFFKQMNRFFADAGVKMLMGTDSPSAHTGLVAGFAVQEELRLLDEIGLTPAQIYEMSAVNPGRFIGGSLGLEVGFGTLEVGKRADLLLLEANPLEDIHNLRRPHAVVARGRLWSQDNLQSRLDALEAKYNP